MPEAERVAGRDGTLIYFQCFHRNKWGHKQWNCPECDPGQGVNMKKYGKQSLNFMECDISLITVCVTVFIIIFYGLRGDLCVCIIFTARALRSA